MALIAGTVELDEVMSRLAAERPVFHSEADFQHAFAQTVYRLAPEVAIRLEVRQSSVPGGKGEYVDLICTGAVKTFIEFKYATARWTGADGITDEEFYVREHAAMDLIRKHFIFDVERLERFTTANPGANGLAVILTNAAPSGSPQPRPAETACSASTTPPPSPANSSGATTTTRPQTRLSAVPTPPNGTRTRPSPDHAAISDGSAGRSSDEPQDAHAPNGCRCDAPAVGQWSRVRTSFDAFSMRRSALEGITSGWSAQ